eukprot:m.328390 g.328390  ORF g.328390 m.328390 type:complete len:80 (+) comp16033_c0_seq7:563-802(+)
MRTVQPKEFNETPCSLGAEPRGADESPHRNFFNTHTHMYKVAVMSHRVYIFWIYFGIRLHLLFVYTYILSTLSAAFALP